MGPRELSSKVVQMELLPNIGFPDAGIRMKTNAFMLPNFIENVTQSVLHAIKIESASVVIGGDGRTGVKSAIDRLLRVLSGNCIRRAVVGPNGWLSMSSATILMREMHCHYGFIFTAGHYPPGLEHGYMGLKIISPPGIPMHREIIEKAKTLSKSLMTYQSCDTLVCDISELGETEYIVDNKHRFSIIVTDPVKMYVREMNNMFDFSAIKDYIENGFNLKVHCCNGVSGPTAEQIFMNELEVASENILNKIPLEDFGGSASHRGSENHEDFVQLLKEQNCQFGVVISPDGCRVSIFGEEGFRVTASDSLAVIAENSLFIPFFKKNPLERIVRSICTSHAVDKVAEKLSLLLFEVLPGWRNFQCAMLSPKSRSILFGEESDGVGASSYEFCSERDGIWTALAWLSIVSSTRKGVRQLMEEHWRKYGRSFFARLDFRRVPYAAAEQMLTFYKEKSTLRFEKIKYESLVGVEYLDPFGLNPKFQTEDAKKTNTEIIFEVENYVHPYGFVKKCLMNNDEFQIYRIQLTDDASVIIRKSESSVNSLILRLYIEHTVNPDSEDLLADKKEILKPFVSAALKITKTEDFVSKSIQPVFV